MTATTPKGIPYPEGSDLVTDGNEAIQALAVAVDLMVPIVGVATVVIGAASAFGSVAVVFPAGLFTTPPLVICTINGGQNATLMNVQVGSITATGCTIAVYHRDAGQTITTTGITVVWLAYAGPIT